MALRFQALLALLLAQTPLHPESSGASPAVKASPPNVLVIVMDDISDRDMDRIPTPHFDALGTRGMRFRRAYGAPVCSPARRMLTFGEYWCRDSGTPCTGRNYPNSQPSTAALSLPRMFLTAGYSTALIGKWHLGSYPGVDEGQPWWKVAQQHGFQTWRAGLSANVRSGCLYNARYNYWQRVDDSGVSISEEYNTQAMADATLGWLAEQRSKGEQPWFGMVCFQGAHGPFHVPPGMGIEGVQYSNRERYELMVQDLDRAIGRILDQVDLANTLVLVVGDNGTPDLVAHSRAEKKRGKTTTFEGGIHVPMVWAGAGVAAGNASEALVSFVDVLPTLAETIGFESPELEDLDGMSLGAVLRDPSQRAHDYIWSGCLGPNVSKNGDYALVTERWKLRLVNGVTSLYDLQLDPEELIDLARPGSHPEVTQETQGAEDMHGELIERLSELLYATSPVDIARNK